MSWDRREIWNRIVQYPCRWQWSWPHSSVPTPPGGRRFWTLGSACPYHSSHMKVREVASLTAVYHDTDIQVWSVPSKAEISPCLGAAPVRLHGKGSSGSELRVQPSAFERKPAQVYSTPALRENAGVCTPSKDTLSKWHLIIAVIGQKGWEGNTPKRQTVGNGCSKATVSNVFLLLLFRSVPISSQHGEL